MTPSALPARSAQVCYVLSSRHADQATSLALPLLVPLLLLLLLLSCTGYICSSCSSEAAAAVQVRLAARGGSAHEHEFACLSHTHTTNHQPPGLIAAPAAASTCTR